MKILRLNGRSEVQTLSYNFFPVTSAEVALLREWRARPHVREWWGPPEIEDPAIVIDEGKVAMWIVSHRGRPFAYAQDYNPHEWENHPFSHFPKSGRGIDQYIGEEDMLGLGHGSRFVRAHIERLFTNGVTVVGTDPHPNNLRAIAAYKNAGFVTTSEPMSTRWGRAILMECRR